MTLVILLVNRMFCSYKIPLIAVMVLLSGQHLHHVKLISAFRPAAIIINLRKAEVGGPRKDGVKFRLSSLTSSTADSASSLSSAESNTPIPIENAYEKASMEDIVSLCKRRGFIFPSSEIYNGFAGFYDYGPLGAELKKNVKDSWWKTFVTRREDVVGLDSSIIHNPITWKSSGKFYLSITRSIG